MVSQVFVFCFVPEDYHSTLLLAMRSEGKFRSLNESRLSLDEAEPYPHGLLWLLRRFHVAHKYDVTDAVSCAGRMSDQKSSEHFRLFSRSMKHNSIVLRELVTCDVHAHE